MPNVYSSGTYIKRIDYNSQGGSAVDQTRGSKSSNAASVSVSASVSTTVPTKTGYTFNGWNSKADGSGTNYAAGDSISHTFTRQASWDHTDTINKIEYDYYTVSNQSHTTTIYAKWTALTYTVSYNANGGSGAPAAQTKTYGVNLALSSTKPTRTGYNFLGWSTSSTATSATYSAGGTYTANAAAVLYAVWSAITYTVSYNKGSNGTGTNTTATKTYNVALTLKGATFTRTGYTQTSWYSTSPAQAFALGGSYTANADITLYPTWTPNKYTVSYNANAGTGVVSNVPDAQTKTYGTALTLSSTKPTRANEAAGSRTVLYDGNGASNPTSSTASRTTSYTFSNWNTAANGSGTAYSSGASYTTNAAATLYAQWTPTTTTASVTLPTITRTGYRFDGWFTAQTGGSQVTSPYTPGNDVVTLYAHWTALSATLSSVSPTPVLCGNTLTGSWTSTGSYYYRLKVTCGNGEEKWSSITAVGATSATVTIPTSWYSMSNGPMKNSEKASATCTLYTYSNSAGTTQVGTATSLPFTAKVPDNVVPTLSSLTYKASSDNPVVSGWGDNVFVQGYSKVTLTLSVSSYNGSALKSVRFSGEGWESSGTSLTSPASTVVNRSGQVKFTAYCTDTRNHQSQIDVDVPFEAYSPPTVSTIAVGRSDKNGNDNNSSGAWIKFTPKFSYSSCGGHNQLSTHTAQYTLHGSSAVLGSLTCMSDITYAPINAEATPPTGTIWPVSATNAYDVSVILVDSIQANAGTNTTLMTTLPSVQGIWYGKGNDRLGLGGVPNGPGLHVDWNAEFNGVLDVTQRRCYATLTGANTWYRVLTFNAESANQAAGYAGCVIDLNIGRKGADNETHSIQLEIVSANVAFSGEKSVSVNKYIDKIRYWRNDNIGYIDIHTLSSNLIVWVDFNVHDAYSSQLQYAANSLEAVSAAPAGSLVAEYTFSGTAYHKPVAAEGISNGWDYVLYADKTIDAIRTITDTQTYYSTINGFYGYYIANIDLPFTMADTNYYIGTTWSIGSGFSVSAGLLSVTTTKFNAYGLGTYGASDASVKLTMHLKGKIA